MHIALPWGKHVLEFEIAPGRVVGSQRQPPIGPIADVAGAVRDALETPHHFPALRRALTPDDQIAVVVDERLQRPALFLVPILEHLRQARIASQSITLVCQPPSTGQAWLEELPDEFAEVRLEVHDPSDRRRLSYLATTPRGRRIYLNRSAVDADQLVILTRRSYDCSMGHAGGEGDLFPALSDEATRKELAGKFSFAAPVTGKSQRKSESHPHWPLHEEALEVAWLTGNPFLVQVIEGTDTEIAGIVAGSIDSSGEGQRLLDARWRVLVDEPADVVVAGVSGDPALHTFADLARAFACAARVVKPGGRVVVLSEAGPALGRSVEIMRTTEDPGKTLSILAEEKPVDHEAGFLWCHAAQQAKLYLLSRLDTDTAEELFVTPLESAGQVERILGSDASCLFLPDAHKTMATFPE